MVRSVETLQTFLKPAQVAKLVAAYEAGATVGELARRFGVHRHTVAAHLARCSVSLRRKGLSDEQARRVCVLYDHGATVAELAERFGVGLATVSRALNAAGVAMRPRGRRVVAE